MRLKLLGRRSGWFALGAGTLAVVATLGLGGLAGRGGAGVATAKVVQEDFAEVVVADGNLAAVRAVPVHVPPEAPSPARIGWLIADGSAVEAGTVVARFDPSELEKASETASADLDRNHLDRRMKQAASEATRSKLAGDAEAARREQEVASRYASSDVNLFSQREIAASKIDEELASRRLDHAESSLEAEVRRARVEGHLAGLAEQRSAVQLRRAEQGLAALTVTAPGPGVLVLERGWRGELPRVGDTVWPGQKLGEIPDPSQLVAEVFVLEADSGGLAAGAPAEVVVEADPDHRYAAVLEKLGTLARPRFPGSPVQYFSATVRFTVALPATLRPGQRLRAFLSTRRQAAALVVPATAVFNRDGRNVVYRRRGRQLEEVEVELGGGVGGRVSIVAGLAAGDEVALSAPGSLATEVVRPGEGGS